MADLLFHPMAALIIRILLGLLFVVSGILKIPDLKGFFVIVVKFGILKGKLARLFAYSLPFAEVIIGLSVFLGFRLIWSSALLLLILLASTSGVIYAFYSKKDIDSCGCYGKTFKVPIDARKIIETSILILLAVYLLLFQLVG